MGHIKVNSFQMRKKGSKFLPCNVQDWVGLPCGTPIKQNMHFTIYNI